MRKAVAYARYSTDNQREESIVAQLRAIQEYAIRNNIEIIQEYTDEARSSTSDDRPAFQRMFRELKSLHPDLVLVHKYDRFARDDYDAIHYERKIEAIGARLIAVDQPLDDSPESGLTKSLLRGLAAYYSKNLAREVMKGMKENAFKAQFNGGWVPLGYDIDSEKHYVINEDEAETVRFIFAQILVGKSYGAIINDLNDQGKLTKRKQPWGKNSIHELLKNEKYMGMYCYNKTPKKVAGKRNNRVQKPDEQIIRVEGAMPAIVSPADWYQVQDILASRAAGPRIIEESPYMLTGVLRCAECGAPMTGYTSRRVAGGEPYRYYVCTKGRRRNGQCNHTTQHKAGPLEARVLDLIDKNIINPKSRKQLAKKLWKSIQQNAKGRDDMQLQIEKKIRELEKQLENFNKFISLGADMANMVEAYNSVGEQKRALENKLIERKSPLENLTLDEINSYLESCNSYQKDDLESCKKIIASNVQEAIIGGSNTFEVTLRYQFRASQTGKGIN